MLRFNIGRAILVAGVMLVPWSKHAWAEQPPKAAADARPAKGADPSRKQSELDAAFGKMLSGATLEGSFTSTGEGGDAAKLSSEKYTLGEVKKLEGNYWLIPARIQYGEKDVTIPLILPVRWAGDTPVIVVDEVGLPGFGTVSARVMFFADHYAGYWKHGKHGGSMFGTISRDEKRPDGAAESSNTKSSSGESTGGEQEEKQAGQQ